MISQCNTVLVVFLNALLGSALTEDIVLVCPPKWIDKQVVTLTCSVAKTSFPGLCKFWNNEMYFIISKNSISATNCTVHSFSLCSSQKPTLGCYCAEENSTHYTFLYKFKAEAGYHGTWVCSVTCVDDDGIPILKNNASSCVNKTVESEMPDPPLPVFSSVGEIVGGTVGGLALISLIAVILYFIRRKRKVHIQDPLYKVVNHSDVSSHGPSGQRSFKISDPDCEKINTDQSV